MLRAAGQWTSRWPNWPRPAISSAGCCAVRLLRRRPTRLENESSAWRKCILNCTRHEERAISAHAGQWKRLAPLPELVRSPRVREPADLGALGPPQPWSIPAQTGQKLEPYRGPNTLSQAGISRGLADQPGSRRSEGAERLALKGIECAQRRRGFDPRAPLAKRWRETHLDRKCPRRRVDTRIACLFPNFQLSCNLSQPMDACNAQAPNR